MRGRVGREGRKGEVGVVKREWGERREGNKKGDKLWEKEGVNNED